MSRSLHPRRAALRDPAGGRNIGESLMDHDVVLAKCSPRGIGTDPDAENLDDPALDVCGILTKSHAGLCRAAAAHGS